MLFSIPIFIEERSGVFVARPLFRSEPVVRAARMNRALTKLSDALREQLQELGREPRHDSLAQWTWHPPLEDTTLELRLELDSGSQRRTFLIAGYPAFGRKIHFTPHIPGLHFEVRPGQELAERATAVFTRHFRELEREHGKVDLDDFVLAGKGRLVVLELEVQPAALAKAPEESAFARIFGGDGRKDGETELRRTGRSLTALYPDDLDRAVGREREVEELTRLLAATDRRPILLVGPRQVGKTAILHELAWQLAARKAEPPGRSPQLWLLSPMRLISGMSVLGEWENRVLAILEHARQKDHVLYFDDLLGLFAAGVSAASSLNVLQVIKPWLERRLVRVVAEITPEAWRVLRERDRGFADLFHVIPVPEPSETETLRVLVSLTRQMEEAHGCEFDLEVVPTVCELHRRFVSGSAFPGKAAGFLRRLAVGFAGLRVTRHRVLEEFHKRSGLQVALLDQAEQMGRDEILTGLRAGVVGQEPVIGAFADILLTLKARLNDPRRPLGTLLLLGPTGVGKTQAARALAGFLFGSSDRLLRFDMNEYLDPASAGRLTGTRGEPEGLLTSAIRRQPFSVILLDEIEKAAPEVFDMLLAVLDEGRLTDALGRVADFTQSVILLTSNLGVREARSRLGFGAAAPSVDSEDALYVGAAEKFFRPEFFNRLDRIIPFRALDRAHLVDIARRHLDDLVAREGLRRRNVILDATPEAMERLVELGTHPQLGARALKRVIEREVARPLAARFAGMPPGTPMIASICVSGEALAVRWHDLTPEPLTALWPSRVMLAQGRSERSTWISELPQGVRAALGRIGASLEAGAPSGRVELDQLSPAQAHYFLCREQFKRVDRLARALERARAAPRRLPRPGNLPRATPVKEVTRQYLAPNLRSDRQREAIELRHNIDDLEDQLVEIPDQPVITLLRELAWLEAVAAGPHEATGSLLIFRSLAEDTSTNSILAHWHVGCLNQLGGTVTEVFKVQTESDALVGELLGGPIGRTLAYFARLDQLPRLMPDRNSTVLVRREDGRLGMILVTREPAASEAAARKRAKQLDARAGTFDPDSMGPVIQMVVGGKTLTDFRTGLVLPLTSSAEEFRALMLSKLPQPEETRAILSKAGAPP